MRIRLDSDFHDYYDHWFAGSWQEADLVFERYTRSGPSRPELMDMLAGQGMFVPWHGRARDLPSRLREAEVVVHFDELAHRAQGKIKCSAGYALESHPDCFCVEYIRPNYDGGYTLRSVGIGHRLFWLEYYNPGDWRSNVGDPSITVLAESVRQEGLLPGLALYAIDFVPAGDHLYAIDLNVAPGLGGTGLEEWIFGREVFEELAGFFGEQTSELAV